MRQIALSVFILLILLGVRFLFFSSNKSEAKVGQNITITSRLLTQPRLEKGRQSFSLQTNAQKFHLAIPSYPRFSYGELVRATGVVKEVGVEKGTILILERASVVRVKENTNFFSFVRTFRNHQVSLFEGTLSDRGAGLLVGVVFGIKQGLDRDYDEALRTAGVFHVVAASGMNVSIVIAMLFGIFTAFLKRQFALILSLFGVFFYAALAGFEPSIVRASIMATIASIALLFGRQQLSLFALFLTGWIMLMLWPYQILDIGFQFSFVATTGILTIKPFLERFFKPTGSVLATDLTTTAAAQLGTLPILLFHFSDVNLLSLLVNALLLWTIPPMMFLGGIAALIGLILPVVAKLLLFLTIPLTAYFEAVVMFTSRFPLTLRMDNVSLFFIAGYYLLIFSMLSLGKIKPGQKTQAKLLRVASET